MTFKDLIDKTTVDWANKLIQEKKDNLSSELNAIASSKMIAGIEFDVNDAISEFNRIKDQLPVLKTYADVFGYAKLNETDFANALQNGIDPSKAAALLGGNGEAPNIASIIAKVQIGGVFSTITSVKPLVTSLLDKIGRETTIDKVSMDDINYLVTKNCETEIQEINTDDENAHLLDEVSEELKQLSDPKASWDKKDNDRQIIEIYLTKLRDKFLSSSQAAILTHGAPMNSMRVTAGTKIMGTMSVLSAKIEFASTLENEYLKSKKN